jgi:hypothetical protein
MVVRRITAGVLRDVVAGPAHAMIASDALAHEIFDALSAESSLFTRDDDVLRPRTDVRRLLLRSRQPDTLQMAAAVHRAAVEYYQDRHDVWDRAEEVYHRLALGQPLGEIDSRWRDGIEASLRRAVEELEGPARAYLAAKLRIDLDELDWLDADQAAWEAYVATRAGDLLSRNEPREALELLKKRSTRQQRSRLFTLEAEALLALAQPREALAVTLQGLELWPDDPELPAVLAKCKSALGAEESAPPTALRGAASADGPRYHVPRDVDIDTLANVLHATLPTRTDVVNAWSRLPVARTRLASAPMRDIVEWAADAGRLDELAEAALHYASPSDVLQEFLERSGLRVDVATSDRVRGPAFRRGQLVFDRWLLRRFLSGLGQSSIRQRMLFVTGPPGSGKSTTIRLARAFVGHRMKLVVVRLDPSASALGVTRELYHAFDWRWESLVDADASTDARTIKRCADMISARLDYQDGGQALVIFHQDGSTAMSADVEALLMELLIMLTDGRIIRLAIIVIAESFLVPKAQFHSVIEELHDFSPMDIEEGLQQVARELHIPAAAVDVLTNILSAVEPGDRYNQRVSVIAQHFIDELMSEFDRWGDFSPSLRRIAQRFGSS